MYLAVNKNGEFRIFPESFCPPMRSRVEILKQSDTEVIEDPYGREWPAMIRTGKYKEVWMYGDSEGYVINKKYLTPELRKMTWENEPLEIK